MVSVLEQTIVVEVQRSISKDSIPGDDLGRVRNEEAWTPCSEISSKTVCKSRTVDRRQDCEFQGSRRKKIEDSRKWGMTRTKLPANPFLYAGLVGLVCPIGNMIPFGNR